MRVNRERPAGQQPAMATAMRWSVRDGFLAGQEPAEGPEYGESIPMDRRPTLRVADILGAGRPEQSWDETPGSGDVRPAQSERSQEIGDLGLAGLHIGAAPARLLARGRRVIQPPGGLLSRTFSGSSARVDYRQRLEMNTQDSLRPAQSDRSLEISDLGMSGMHISACTPPERRKGRPAQRFQHTASERSSGPSVPHLFRFFH